jgi:hypothetical protein
MLRIRPSMKMTQDVDADSELHIESSLYASLSDECEVKVMSEKDEVTWHA